MVMKMREYLCNLHGKGQASMSILASLLFSSAVLLCLLFSIIGSQVARGPEFTQSKAVFEERFISSCFVLEHNLFSSRSQIVFERCCLEGGTALGQFS